MNIRFRLGSFLYLIGTALIMIFFLSILGKEANLAYLLLALVAVFFGYLFRKKSEPQESGRFSTIKRLTNRNQQNQVENQDDERK